MTNKDAFKLYRFIESGEFNALQGAKFQYALMRNKNILKSELTLVEGTVKLDPKYAEYDGKRLELLKKFAKQEDGKPVIEDNHYIIDPGRETEFNEAVNAMQEEYKDTLLAREKVLNDYDVLLEQEISFDLHKIKLEDIPENINGVQMEHLMGLVAE